MRNPEVKARVPAEVKRALAEAARKERRTLSATLKLILIDGLKARAGKGSERAAA